MAVTSIEAFIGSPGTGKTYSLAHKVNELLKNDETVHIMNPTRSSRNNLRKAFKKLFLAGEMSKKDYNKTFIANNVKHEYNQTRAQHVFIEESAMVDIVDLYAIIFIAQTIPDVHMYLYGDLKQIEPVRGESILKTLIESSISKSDGRNIWEFVNQTLYKDMPDSLVIKSPIDWQVNLNVDVTVFKKNYRLQNEYFADYNDEYYKKLISEAIFEENYQGYIKYAIDNYYLITTPTHARGKEIDEMAMDAYGDKYRESVPFIFVGGEYFLNPFHKDYDTLKEHFDFINEILTEDIPDEYKLTSYMSTHKVQSFTVDNVVFYMGNNPIGNRNKTHYSNNMMYTALTRARYEAKLLGNPDSFEQMRNTMPKTPQDQMGSIRSAFAMKSLLHKLGVLPAMTPDEIYNTFSELFNDDKNLPPHELNYLNTYNINSKKYTMRYVINQVNNEYNYKYGFILSKWLVDRKNDARSERAKGKGRVQLIIDGMSEEEKIEMFDDLSNRKVKDSDFTSRYGLNKKSVRNALNNMK